jgi:hypothetical protein
LIYFDWSVAKMKKVVMLFALLGAFSLTAFAQDAPKPADSAAPETAAASTAKHVKKHKKHHAKKAAEAPAETAPATK